LPFLAALGILGNDSLTRMDNRDVAAVFAEMADLLDLEDGDPYRIRAFRRIGRTLESLTEPLSELLKYGRLERIPGIGEGGMRRIKEILATGTCQEHRRLRARVPIGLRELPRIEGIGPRTVKQLYQALGIGSVAELEWAVRQGRLARVPGLGPHVEARIRRGLEAWQRQRTLPRLRLDEAYAQGSSIVRALGALPGALQVQMAGSVRRAKEMVEDLDILVASLDGARVVARFVTLPEVTEVLARSAGRASVRLASGHQADLRVIAPESLGAALHYFTGSKAHNIAMRARATRMQLKLGDHGIFRRYGGERVLSGVYEADIFAALGLPYIAPELRENTGEIEAAAGGTLPELVTEEMIQGDLHVAVRPEGMGEAALAELAATAGALGLRYLALAGPAAPQVGQVGVRELRWMSERTGVRLLDGALVDVLPDGHLAADPALLAQREWVVARIPEEEPPEVAAGMERTARLIRAMESGVVDCVAHPTGRLLGQRAPAALDVERLLRAALRLGVAVELNADPRRLDLDAVACRRARELQVLVAINSGAGSAAELWRRRFGVVTGRRGWLAARDVINTRSVDEVLAWRHSRLRRRGVMVGGSVSVPVGLAPAWVPAAPPAAAPVSPAVAVPVASPIAVPVAPAEPAEPARLKARAARAARAVPTGDGATEERLALALQQLPLEEKLRARVERFLKRGKDEVLEAALGHLGPNPLQKAFELVATDPAPPATPDGKEGKRRRRRVTEPRG
jgi:DNA polymerase (family 10)